jgi:hypothetical protein
MSSGPFTPLSNLPWIRWIDRSEIPAFVIGIATLLFFVPFYDYNALAPRMPLQGAAFPPAFALALAFLLLLTRGAANDLRQLIIAEKIDTRYLESLAAGRRAAAVELLIGLVVGLERVYSQIQFSQEGPMDLSVLLSPGAVAVTVAIIGYTVVQVHLLMFCFRQVKVFRRVSANFEVNLLAPELNNVLSNPLIRFVALGVVGFSFGLVIYELVPYASLQRRLMEGSLVAAFVWLTLIVVSMVPLFLLKSRIAVAKKMEINLIRRALKGDFRDVSLSHFGEQLAAFSPADLMFYEDRVNDIWEWPFEAQVRRLVLFGLLPPLTWILAAAVEVVFETFLSG